MPAQRRLSSKTLAFHASRIVIDAGVLLAMASMSFTFVNAESGDRSALALDALPAVLLLLPIFLITLIPDHTRPLPRPLGWASLVLGLTAFPYSIVKYLDAKVLADTLGGSVGPGPLLLVLGAFMTLVGIGVGMTRSLLGLPTGGSPAPVAPLHPSRREIKAPPVEETPDEGTRVAPSRRDSGSTDARRSGPSQHPARPSAHTSPEESPFGEQPLFDSLEIPAFVAKPSDVAAGDRERPNLTFEAEDATDRNADEED